MPCPEILIALFDLPVGEAATLEEVELAALVIDDPALVAVALDEVVVTIPGAAESYSRGKKRSC
jgi:hypothetical protein